PRGEGVVAAAARSDADPVALTAPHGIAAVAGDDRVVDRPAIGPDGVDRRRAGRAGQIDQVAADPDIVIERRRTAGDGVAGTGHGRPDDEVGTARPDRDRLLPRRPVAVL